MLNYINSIQCPLLQEPLAVHIAIIRDKIQWDLTLMMTMCVTESACRIDIEKY